MKLLVMNPNTSEAMTEDIRKTVMAVKKSDVEVDVSHSDFGAESLESFYDYHLAAFGMIRYIKTHPKDYDGILVSCFGDPGLYAIEEICDCPVIGIAEATISIANLLGAKFSILAASEKAAPMMDNLVAGYGMQARSAGTFAINMSVLGAEKDKAQAIERLIAVGKKAKECGAEVLIPGCAGMTGLAEAVESELGIRVLDPVEIGYSVLEMLVEKKIPAGRFGLTGDSPTKTIVKDHLLTIN